MLDVAPNLAFAGLWPIRGNAVPGAPILAIHATSTQQKFGPQEGRINGLAQPPSGTGRLSPALRQEQVEKRSLRNYILRL